MSKDEPALGGTRSLPCSHLYFQFWDGITSIRGLTRRYREHTLRQDLEQMKPEHQNHTVFAQVLAGRLSEIMDNTTPAIIWVIFVYK